MKKPIILFVLCLFYFASPAQELLAKMTIISTKLSTSEAKKTFQTLQNNLGTFLNNRKWTNDPFQPQEKIKCNFLLSIDQDLGKNVYKASLTIQAARPIYNSTYESPIINFQDNDLTFRYMELQPIEFNESRIQGTDPLAANLTAILAYYVNIILGMDYDSFSPRGGDPFFQKAQNIVNNAPESGDITGWKTFDGLRNRYKLIDNLTDSRYTILHDAIYSYYRSGLDLFSENEEEGRNGILASLNFLNKLNGDNPNSMVLQFFLQGKSGELVKIFSHASPDVKQRARDLLSKIDITNATAYKELR